MKHNSNKYLQGKIMELLILHQRPQMLVYDECLQPLMYKREVIKNLLILIADRYKNVELH